MSQPYRTPNSYRSFLRAGRGIAQRIARLDGVVGILGTGAIGRRFGDRFSDLDLTVYAYPHAVTRLRRIVSIGWIRHRGMDFDIPVLSYEKALKAPVPSRYWTQVARWDHQNAQLLHDTGRRIESLLAEKVVYPEREQRRLLKMYREEVQERLVFLPEVWAERGEPHHVMSSLTAAAEYIIRWLYARQRLFEPYLAKWLFYHLEMCSLPEHVHLPLLAQVYAGGATTTTAAMELRGKLLALCETIGLRFDATGVEDARRRGKARWRQVSEDTRRILSW